MVILISGLAKISMLIPVRVRLGIWSLLEETLRYLNHLEAGKRIFFFEAVGKGLVQYKSELELHDFDYQQGKDREGNDRQMIIFYFKKVGVQIRVEKPQKFIPNEQSKHL